MHYKSSQYKLDFKFKYGTRKYNADECTLYHSSSYYRHWGLLSLIHREYIEAGKQLDFWNMMVPSDYPDEHHYNTDVVREQFLDFIKSGKPYEEYRPPDGTRPVYELSQVVNHVAKNIAMRTSRFDEARSAFNTWIKTRPGVVDVYKKYREEFNKKVLTPNRSIYESSLKPLPENLDIEAFAQACNGRKFKLLIENSRPLKFSAGDVVRLKREFYNKRGKDPLYHSYDNELKKMDRIGTVMKKVGANHTYGVGSREIRVMWFMNGQESAVMERCLKIVDIDELPAATKEK